MKKFAERRFFRIFPTIAFAMLLMLPLTLFGSPDLRYQLRQQTFAGLGFVSNLFEATSGQSYDNSFAPHLFVHLWSLSIEVQFYLFWAIILWLVVRFSKRLIEPQVFMISFLIFVLAAISMIGAAIETTDYSPIYYSPIFHIFPFFIGAVLASIVGIKSTKLVRQLAEQYRLPRLILFAVISSLLLVLLALFLHFNDKFTYLFGFLLASLLTAALIFFLRLIHEKTTKEEPKLIKIIADISYGVYIFHWAFFVIFLNYRISHGLAVFLTFVLSFGLSALSFYGIEPILRGRRKLSKIQRRVLIWVGILLFIPSAFALGNSTQETSLAQTLWTGNIQSEISSLYFSEKIVEKGTLGMQNLVIGDSVTVGVSDDFSNAEKLQEVIPETFVDAQGSRKISDLQEELDSYLPMMPKHCNLIIALGTNSFDPKGDIALLQKMIEKYSEAHHIVLVTPANWSGGTHPSDQIADWELSIQGKYKNIKIADWRAASASHPEYFDQDMIHISDRPAGRAEWISLVKSALDEK